MNGIMSTCKYCGKEFVKKSNSQKYCCEECQLEAKKLQDKYNSHKRYKANKLQNKTIIGICSYCKKPFIKRHGNQKYCSKSCSDKRKMEQDCDAALRYYYHVRKKRGGDKAWGLGTGSLGPHMHEDFETEKLKVENELKRRGLFPAK